LSLTDEAEFLYKCDDVYHGDDCRGIAWNDPTFGIDWGVGDPTLSPADAILPRITDLDSGDLPAYV